MKRRHLLKYGTYAVCGYGLSACDQLPRLGQSARNPQPVKTLDEILGKPEKTTLALAYEPNISVAPWLVAIAQGFFEQYGLEVKLYKQPNAAEVERGLLESRFDAAITSFAVPLIYQVKKPKVDLVALMQVHRHGSAFTLGQNTWEKKVRSGIDYANFEEFAQDYRTYVRTLENKTFGVDHPYSIGAYLYRYWWAALGFHPERDLKLVEFSGKQLHYKLQAQEIQGYCSLEPWSQAAIAEGAGFIGYLSADIWRGHPEAVLTTKASLLKEHPNTAKILLWGTLMGCQFCQDSVNAAAVADLLQEPLDLEASQILPLLNGQYFYGGEGDRPLERKDSPIWFGTGEKRLPETDAANYCWQSHGIWLLTQMVRWQHFGLREYPSDAQALIEAAYPTEPLREVAKAYALPLPSASSQTETQFIDQRTFDPEQALGYLNQFKIRT